MSKRPKQKELKIAQLNYLKRQTKQAESSLKMRKQFTDYKTCKKCDKKKEYTLFLKENKQVSPNCDLCRRKGWLKSKYDDYKRSDIDKKLDTSDFLSIHHFKKLFSMPCQYCKHEQSNGIDRLDNSFGHTSRNCIPCCGTCNMTRGNRLSPEEMMLLGEVVSKIKENRKNDILYENKVTPVLYKAKLVVR